VLENMRQGDVIERGADHKCRYESDQTIVSLRTVRSLVGRGMIELARWRVHSAQIYQITDAGMEALADVVEGMGT
jgi:hypothetical protein